MVSFKKGTFAKRHYNALWKFFCIGTFFIIKMYEVESRMKIYYTIPRRDFLKACIHGKSIG